MTWREDNQRYLMALLLDQDADAIRNEMSPPPAMDTLAEAFSLTPFERHMLLLAAAPDLNATCNAPTFGTALATIETAHWSALSPASPLRFWRLIELGDGPNITNRPIHIDERILQYLTGFNHLDERLQPHFDAVPAMNADAPDLVRILQEETEDWPFLHLLTSDPQAARAHAAGACAELRVPLFALRAATIPATAAEQETIARLFQREALLTGCMLFADLNAAEDQCRTLAFLATINGDVVITSPDRIPPQTRAVVTIELNKPTPAEQHTAWRDALSPANEALNGHIGALVSQFDLTHSAIRDIARQAATPTALWDACRKRNRARMGDLATFISARARMEDLVLPAEHRATLEQIAAHVRRRFHVYETWGFAQRTRGATGVTALFAGPSGTGKTMAAEVLAHELHLDLYQIDLSTVVSKYIGETEKHLSRIFAAGEESGAILLFDEADALYGKRSDVRDSHDRYANLEVSYLLQRMESYRGLAILTTNMKTAMDTAFLRRLSFVLNFPFPDLAQRAEIWQRIFPAQTPTEGLDAHKLARLSVAGGSIRNIALNAAFLAADSGEPVRMPHVLAAARSEYLKLEKPAVELE